MATISFPDPFAGKFGGYFEGSESLKSPLEKCTIDGIALPGLVEINVKTQREVEKKKSQGSPGASLTWKGWKPTDISIVVHVWTPAHFKTLEQVLNRIWPAPAKNFQGFQIISEVVNSLHINSVAIVGVSGIKPGKVANQWTLEISATEYSPVKSEKKSERIIKANVNSNLASANSSAANQRTAGGKQINEQTSNAKKSKPSKNSSDIKPG